MGVVESKERREPPSSHEAARRHAYNNHTNRDSSPASDFNFLSDLLLHVFNSPQLSMAYVSRLAMIESIRRLIEKATLNEGDPYHYHRVLTEIAMEGILTCSSMKQQDKETLLRDGMFDQRWDIVAQTYWKPLRYKPVVCIFDRESHCLQDFANYRRLFVHLVRTSRYCREDLPPESSQRLEKMILQTQSYEALETLLVRVIHRTCPIDVQEQLAQDASSCRYYRLLWADRLNCYYESTPATRVATIATRTVDVQESGNIDDDDDTKKPAAATTPELATPTSFAYGKLHLQFESSSINNNISVEICPVCLDSIRNPALELTCGHVFCSGCISEWIAKHHHRNNSNNTAAAAASKPRANSVPWHCPICRKAYD